MAKIDLRRRKAPEVGAMRDRVIICTTVERPDEDVSTIVERPGVFECQANILNLKPDQILDYKAVFGTEGPAPTIQITIRYPWDAKIDLNHWVYRKTGDTPAWYKVRSVEDLGGVGRFLVLYCSIDVVNDTRNDPVTQEPPPVWETPDI
jgi:hypothetical protein